MSITRRRFLSSGAMAVVTTGVAFSGATGLAFARDRPQADRARDFTIPSEAKAAAARLTRDMFQPHVGSTFTVSAGAKSIEMTLVRVRDCTPSPKNKSTSKSRPTDSYALVFRSTQQLTDLTSIYNVQHGALGRLTLFMTRRDGPQNAFFYEAVFNHAL